MSLSLAGHTTEVQLDRLDIDRHGGQTRTRRDTRRSVLRKGGVGVVEYVCESQNLERAVAIYEGIRRGRGRGGCPKDKGTERRMTWLAGA